MRHLFLLAILLIALAACESSTSNLSKPEVLSFRGDHDTYLEYSDQNTSSNTNNNEIEAGMLTAGEWNDLEHWDFWQDLTQQAQYYDYQEHWNCYPHQAYKIQWLDALGEPVIDAPLYLMDGEKELWITRTNNKGEAVLWLNPFEAAPTGNHKLTVHGYYQGQEHILKKPKPYAKGVNTVDWTEEAHKDAYSLVEIMFVVDATGSMGDELQYLNLELNAVMRAFKEQEPMTDIRLGAILYRDHGDDYLMRKVDLTNNLQDVFSFLREQNADGGGDFPEAVDEALEAAISKQAWHERATARLLFLLLDAPSRHDEANLKRLQESITLAAKQGIQIIPVASSGIDKETEFLARFMAQLTNGTYTFITDHSGIGNAHIEPTIGDYEVEFLNDLLMRLLLERTAAPKAIVQ